MLGFKFYCTVLVFIHEVSQLSDSVSKIYCALLCFGAVYRNLTAGRGDSLCRGIKGAAPGVCLDGTPASWSGTSAS